MEMKMEKEENEKTKLHLNMKKIKITIQDLYNFNITMKKLNWLNITWVIDQNGVWSQEMKRRLRLLRTSLKKSLSVRMHHWESMVKIIPAALFSITKHRCENWTMKQTDTEKKSFRLRRCVERELYRYDRWPEKQEVDSRLNLVWTLTGKENN